MTTTTSEARIATMLARAPPILTIVPISRLRRRSDSKNTSAAVASVATATITRLRKTANETPNELGLVIDREKAQHLGVNPQVVAGVVGYALRGSALPDYRAEDGREIPIESRIIAAADMLEDAAYLLGAVRHAHDVGVQAETHHPGRTVSGVLDQLVELVDRPVGIFGRPVALD